MKIEYLINGVIITKFDGQDMLEEIRDVWGREYLKGGEECNESLNEKDPIKDFDFILRFENKKGRRNNEENYSYCVMPSDSFVTKLDNKKVYFWHLYGLAKGSQYGFVDHLAEWELKYGPSNTFYKDVLEHFKKHPKLYAVNENGCVLHPLNFKCLSNEHWFMYETYGNFSYVALDFLDETSNKIVRVTINHIKDSNAITYGIYKAPIAGQTYVKNAVSNISGFVSYYNLNTAKKILYKKCKEKIEKLEREISNAQNRIIALKQTLGAK